MENLKQFIQLGGAEIDTNMSFDLIKNFIIVVIIICGLLLICKTISLSFENNIEYDNTTSNYSCPSCVTQLPCQEYKPSLPCKECKPPLPCQECQINSTDSPQQIYKKYDEIIKPSSTKPNSYIGRDYVCFREKLGDQTFMSKRTGCMACQVDSRKIPEKYGGTETNVIASCVYNENTDPNDKSVWTKNMCLSECAKLKDIN